MKKCRGRRGNTVRDATVLVLRDLYLHIKEHNMGDDVGCYPEDDGVYIERTIEFEKLLARTEGVLAAHGAIELEELP